MKRQKQKSHAKPNENTGDKWMKNGYELNIFIYFNKHNVQKL